MNAQFRSPWKIQKGRDNSFIATLTFPVQVSQGYPPKSPNMSQTKLALMSCPDTPFLPIDILAPAKRNNDMIHFYIFDTFKYSPCKVEKQLKATRKLLQGDLAECAKVHGGFKSISNSLQQWGPRNDSHCKHFSSYCSKTIMKTKKQLDVAKNNLGVEIDYKLASTNGTRDLFVKANGNVKKKRKTSEFGYKIFHSSFRYIKKDSFGRTTVVLRLWIPNQTA